MAYRQCLPAGLALCLVVACARGDSAAPDSGGNEATATAVFTPPSPGAGAAWGSIPYPSDLFLDAEGKLTLRSLPSGPDPDPQAQQFMTESLARLDGAGVNSHVYVPVTGAVDNASLAGNAKLLDLTTGEELAVDLLYRQELGAIQIAPLLGSMLAEDRTYAAYVTTGVKATDGTALAPSAAFRQATDLAATPSDPAVAAAQASLRPLVESLAPATVASLASATVFRTEHVSAELRAMRDVAVAAVPRLTTDGAFEVFASEERLDYLFGGHLDAPTPPGASDDELQPMWHGDVAFVLHGYVDLPSFLNAEPSTAGFLERGSDGKPRIKGRHAAKFTLILPTPAQVGGSYANLPVIQWVHGINRGRGDMIWLANEVCKRGFALAAIDLIHHGDRFASATDLKNNAVQKTAADGFGPDGFGDNVPTSPAARYFHLVASGGIAAYHPYVITENLRQSAIDLIAFAQFLGEMDPADLATIRAQLPDTLPTDLSFRAGETGLITESFGAMPAVLAMAVDDRIDVALLASPAASFPYPLLLHSANFSAAFSQIILGPHGVLDRTTLGDPVSGAGHEPVVMLWNTVVERGDPAAYARLLLTGALRDDGGPSFLLSQTWQDEWVPNEAVEHLTAILGLPLVRIGRTATPPGPLFRYVPSLAETDGPIEANLNAGTRSAASSLWYPAAHALPRKYWDYYDFEPDFPPFATRAERCNFIQPVAQVHEYWGSFFSAYFAGDKSPPVGDPFAAVGRDPEPEFCGPFVPFP